MKSIFVCYTAPTTNNPYNSKKEEIEYALKNENNVLFYDEITDSFYNANGEIQDIAGLRIFFRTNISKEEIIREAILRQGGYSLNTKDNIDKIKQWSKFIPTKRNLILATGKEILENKNLKSRIFDMQIDNEIFLKTVQKNFSDTINIDEFIERKYGLIDALELHSTEEFMISEKVEIIEDEYGKQEYRCFVLDGKIKSISRPLFSTPHPIPEEVKEEAQKLLEHIIRIADFPTTFSMDMAHYMIPKRNVAIYDIVELNPLEATGEYLYNTIWENAIAKRKNEADAIMTKEQLLKDNMRKIPVYKKKKISLKEPEQNTLCRQRFEKDSFSYHYQSLKKFGKQDPPFIWIHIYVDDLLFKKTDLSIEEIFSNMVCLRDVLPYIAQELEQEGIDITSEEFLEKLEINDRECRKESISNIENKSSEKTLNLISKK